MESITDDKSLAWDDEKLCRICLNYDDAKELVAAPCNCRGSMSHLHVECLEQWLNTSLSTSCDICNKDFRTVWVRKPFLSVLCNVWGKKPSIKLILAVVVLLVAYLVRAFGFWGLWSTFIALASLLAVHHFSEVLFTSLAHWKGNSKIVLDLTS
uniref:Uncharacterized protein n=1 Tax=Graphocephala atropunctata TaxID=36148 RepID=A0A1B6KBJ9_9HEMI